MGPGPFCREFWDGRSGILKDYGVGENRALPQGILGWGEEAPPPV